MKKMLIISLLAIVPFAASFGANLTIPLLELYTRGYIEDGSLIIGTNANMDLRIDGGYKFGGRVMLTYETYDLEDLAADRSILFKGASILIRELFGLPLSLTYFTGTQETFAAGTSFPEVFGSVPFASRYRGFLYFPDPDQIKYDGIHTVDGTGLRIETSGLWDSIDLSFYLYQDAYLGSGFYSADVWGMFNWEKFKMEAFLGASFPVGAAGYYRGGLLLYYDTGTAGRVLAQVGIPLWDPAADPFTIDLFYFLFEPRVQFGAVAVFLTLFWHPEFYLMTVTDELGSADININVLVGKPEVSPFSGGLETKLTFTTANPENLTAHVSPYLSAVTSGVVWDFKINAKIFPFSLEDMFQAVIGVRAEL